MPTTESERTEERVDSEDEQPSDEPSPAYEDPTIWLLDSLNFALENLELLAIAAPEAHRRDERFSELLRYKTLEVKREIEGYQSETVERLQERRGKLENRGGDRE